MSVFSDGLLSAVGASQQPRPPLRSPDHGPGPALHWAASLQDDPQRRPLLQEESALQRRIRERLPSRKVLPPTGNLNAGFGEISAAGKEDLNEKKSLIITLYFRLRRNLFESAAENPQICFIEEKFFLRFSWSPRTFRSLSLKKDILSKSRVVTVAAVNDRFPLYTSRILDAPAHLDSRNQGAQVFDS